MAAKKTRARIAYEVQRKEIDGQIEDLKRKLKAHNSESEKEPKNWGFEGDLSYVSARLAEIVEFISDQGGA